MGNQKQPHHRGAHQRIARLVTDWANSSPAYRCPRCGQTRAEGVAQWGAQGEWEAGHIVDGNAAAGYQPEHRHCNRSAGATAGNLKRRDQPMPW